MPGDGETPRRAGRASDPCGPDTADVSSLTDPGRCDLIASISGEDDLTRSLGSSSPPTA